MLNALSIDTGAPRNVQGHFISGALASGILAGSLTYKKQQSGEITTKESMSKIARASLQGGIATASAISTANHMSKGNWIGATLSLGAGLLGVYATEKFYDKLDTKQLAQEVE